MSLDHVVIHAGVLQANKQQSALHLNSPHAPSPSTSSDLVHQASKKRARKLKRNARKVKMWQVLGGAVAPLLGFLDHYVMPPLKVKPQPVRLGRPQPVQPETPIDEVDAKIRRLKAAATPWAQVSSAERAKLLRRCLDNAVEVSPLDCLLCLPCLLCLCCMPRQAIFAAGSTAYPQSMPRHGMPSLMPPRPKQPTHSCQSHPAPTSPNPATCSTTTCCLQLASELAAAHSCQSRTVTQPQPHPFACCTPLLYSLRRSWLQRAPRPRAATAPEPARSTWACCLWCLASRSMWKRWR